MRFNAGFYDFEEAVSSTRRRSGKMKLFLDEFSLTGSMKSGYENTDDAKLMNRSLDQKVIHITHQDLYSPISQAKYKC